MSISIIIPTLNESSVIVSTLRSLQPMRARGHEIILVDGGSGDDTIKLAQPYVDKTISTSPGRARQMNKGALNATKNFLWFLHADTCIPENA
ncbi:MAG TPA: glycosyltransferase, partial [Thiotrichales bacterium]|nr:glycosyltransferase [Thiotrichales bacterium]